MKKLKLFAALCCVAAAFAACDKENEPVINPPHNDGHDTTTVIQPEPHYNVELFFNIKNINRIDLDTIKKYGTNTRIDTIFMIPDDLAGPGGGLSGQSTNNITIWRNLLQQRIDVSPKVRGKGDLWFGVGQALPADSLWFVQQGWTVNQSRNNQR
ncbi:MAG: hypothetical protein PUE55_05905 [Bacteroidales bacterium]|nr:hypothetical protein [Bacteroidales bacterium]